MAPLLSGCYTVEDGRLYRLLRQLADSEGIRLEPSALAGLPGMGHLCAGAGAAYARERGIALEAATHIAWAAAWSRRISGRATTTWANKPYRALISV